MQLQWIWLRLPSYLQSVERTLAFATRGWTPGQPQHSSYSSERANLSTPRTREGFTSGYSRIWKSWRMKHFIWGNDCKSEAVPPTHLDRLPERLRPSLWPSTNCFSKHLVSLGGSRWEVGEYRLQMSWSLSGREKNSHNCTRWLGRRAKDSAQVLAKLVFERCYLFSRPVPFEAAEQKEAIPEDDTRVDLLMEAFVSIQLEKMSLHEEMLNLFYEEETGCGVSDKRSFCDWTSWQKQAGFDGMPQFLPTPAGTLQLQEEVRITCSGVSATSAAE
ncbi:uncharacterized protein [Takifugu rubripes]|uniref:uncharacterized protein n=1 Tax=Takifugu rubripes TaxID=31033 RepID=UPI0011460E14|nr:uncharacterized protein LOC105418862 [Takifugu rubripes]